MLTYRSVILPDKQFLTIIRAVDREEFFCAGKDHLSSSPQHVHSYLLSPSFLLRRALKQFQDFCSCKWKKRSSTSEREKKEEKVLSGRI